MQSMLSPSSKMLTGDITLKMSCSLYGRSSVTVTFLGTDEILSSRRGYSTTYVSYMKHIHAISKVRPTDTDYDTARPPAVIMLHCLEISSPSQHATRIKECPPLIITLHCLEIEAPPINMLYSL
jgi:hypothetical protein